MSELFKELRPAFIMLVTGVPLLLLLKECNKHKSIESLKVAAPIISSEKYNMNDEIHLSSLTGGSKMKSYRGEVDMALPTALFDCFRRGKILDAEEVAKAFGKVINAQDLSDDTVLGFYRKIKDDSSVIPVFEMKPITKANLHELKEKIEVRYISTKDINQLKTTWLQRELNRNWVSANKEPQLG